MSANARTRRLRFALVAACAMVVCGGAFALWLRHRPSTGDAGTAPAPACFGDKRCANERAVALAKAAHDEDEGLLLDAIALQSAYGRDDCDAATELAGGIERFEVDRAKKPDLGRAIDDAVRGRLGYCALAARKTTTQPSPGSAIRLERHGCYGSCGIYDVEVRIDGLVVWEGKGMVVKLGRAEHRIAPQRARELFDAFEHLGFEKGPAGYDSGIDDAPVVDVTLDRDGRHHSLHDDAACEGTPSVHDGTCYLERRIDEVAETAAWISDRRDR